MITPRAEKIIKNHVLLSIGISAIPIPMLDLILVYYVQLDMLKQLSREYNKNYYELRSKAFISALASTTVARMGASFIKAIPGVGSVLGGVSSVVLSGASTYAVGKVAARFLQDDIELSDVDMDMARSFFQEEMEAGKKFAKRMMKEKKEEKENMDPDEYSRKEREEKEIYQKLITLKKLRDDNLITEEEYDAKREEFMHFLGL